MTALVGPGFTLSLKKGSNDVSTLKAGAYRITVTDKATNHNFHLYGPGVDKSTTVKEKVTNRVWDVTFRAGKYTIVCDPHRSSMISRFKVTK